MTRPPTEQLKAQLPCRGFAGDGAAALTLCEEAARDTGFLIASRSRSSVVLLPAPRRSLGRCIVVGRPAPSGVSSSAGRGVVVELADVSGRGVPTLYVTASRDAEVEAFLAALRGRLEAEGPPRATSPRNVSNHHRQEALAYYAVARILSDPRGEPGAAMAEHVQRLQLRCAIGTSEDAEEDGTEQQQRRPMVECAQATRELATLVESSLAAASAHAAAGAATLPASELAPWLLPSVERCLLSRLGPALWRFYAGSREAEDALYARKAQALLSVPAGRLLDALGVGSRFRGAPSIAPPSAFSSSSATPRRRVEAAEGCEVESSGPDGSELSENTRSTADTEEVKPSFFLLDSQGCCYGRASAALARVEAALSGSRGAAPREALEALTFSQLEMKACAFEASGGLVELNSMDDIMPLFIFVLLRSPLSHPLACAQLLGDALTWDERLDCEGRAVLLLDSAARHVANDWDITDLTRYTKI